MRASAKVKPSDTAPSSMCSPRTTSTNESFPSSSTSNTGSAPRMTSPLNCSKALRTHSTLLFLPHWNWGQTGDQGIHSFLLLFHQYPMLLLPQHHQQTGMSSPLRFFFPTNSLFYQIMNDVANELLHGGFTYLFINLLMILFPLWIICLPAMTSARIFKDTLRNDTQVFLNFRDSIFEICLHLINSNFTSDFLPSLMRSSGAGASKEIPLNNSEVSLPAIPITFLYSLLQLSWLIKSLFNFIHYQ